jgi:hypothetical protein
VHRDAHAKLARFALSKTARHRASRAQCVVHRDGKVKTVKLERAQLVVVFGAPHMALTLIGALGAATIKGTTAFKTVGAADAFAQ